MFKNNISLENSKYLVNSRRMMSDYLCYEFHFLFVFLLPMDMIVVNNFSYTHGLRQVGGIPTLKKL